MSRVAAVIPAAGKGTRLGFKTPKTLLDLDGSPILARTISVFARSRRIGVIQPVLPRAHLGAFGRMLAREGWERCAPAVPGGRERQDSVAAGLRALPEDVDYVVIHDGARPFVPLALIHRVLDEARRHGAAIAALPVQDTVKRGSPHLFLEGTVDRRGLWLAQTPQAFRLSLLREAFANARSQPPATDEAALVEALGHPVRIVPGSPLNLKITTREDLALGRALFQEAPRSARTRGGGKAR